MSTRLYAAYGSNLHPARLRERIPSAKLLGTTGLIGWRLVFDKRGSDGSAKCNIDPREGGIVHVAIYQMAAAEKSALDAIEGPGYDVRTISLGAFGTGFTYVANDVVAGLRPYAWYRELVILGAHAQRFPAELIDWLHQISTLQDPEKQRRSENWRRIAAIRAGRAL